LDVDTAAVDEDRDYCSALLPLPLAVCMGHNVAAANSQEAAAVEG